VNIFDNNNVWHPYTKTPSAIANHLVESAEAVYLNLEGGHRVIDGMSSWWSVIHGYNNPTINKALKKQIDTFSHIMFGGLTHTGAIELSKKLVNITPKNLEKVFLADSGSVSVEVALKMALQYWQNKGQKSKVHFISPRGGYHGDTFGAMSVCDPINSMHSLFKGFLPQHFFSQKPTLQNTNEAINDLEQQLIKNQHKIAALILEPILQGAGGMNIYHSDYLLEARKLCDKYDVLMIVDEIATGFGRTGKLFACEYANISPDILCLGKALTGGYMTMAATLTTKKVADAVAVLMHGPTFMANPLACAAANASIELLLSSNWQEKITAIESILKAELLALKDEPLIADVRVIGAIGILEFKEELDIKTVQDKLISKGVWLRPYGKLLYTMPPFIITDTELMKIIKAMRSVVKS